MVKNKRSYLHKKYTASKKQRDNTQEEKTENMLVKVYVSVLMIVLAFAITHLNNPKAEALQVSLKTAISQNVTIEEAKQIGEKSIDKIRTFRGKDMAEQVEDTVEEVFLPNDAATVN